MLSSRKALTEGCSSELSLSTKAVRDCACVQGTTMRVEGKGRLQKSGQEQIAERPRKTGG